MMNRSANVDVEFCESGYLFAFKQKKCPNPLICIENSYAKMA